MKLFAGLILIISGIAAFWSFRDRHDVPRERGSSVMKDSIVPVLVELFTSEGCSSCPPADSLLSKLDEQPIAGVEIIALEEHVDYWNNLGWRDPYSSPAFSKRQNSYADAFGTNNVYTPQMIVDGRQELVGSNESKARAAILNAAKLQKGTVEIQQANKDQQKLSLFINVSNLPQITDGDSAEVLVVVTEDSLSSDVSRGENAGHLLKHTGVVRQLFGAGHVADGERSVTTHVNVPLSTEWKTGNLHVVVFVQEQRSRRVLAAATSELAK